MEIIDKYGYLEGALNYIEKNIISVKNPQKISAKTGIEEFLLKKLKENLKKFSEKDFFTLVKEKLEDVHSSLSGAMAEVSGVDISIEKNKKGAYILLSMTFTIVVDGEVEDNIKLNIKIC